MESLLSYKCFRQNKAQEDSMNLFIQKYHKKVTGILSGFDRLVLKGSIRFLSYTAGMMNFLYDMGVLLKDFGEYVQRTTEQLRVASYEVAQCRDRPNIYLQSPKRSKELLAKQIMHKDKITDGLICLLRCVEPCISYKIRRDRNTKKLILEPKQRRCLHIYHYWVDPVFGFMSARIQTWLPFTIYICLNGREWLARQMDGVGMKYKRIDNCFTWLEDVGAAQRLMDEQLESQWVAEMDLIALKLNPAHDEIFQQYELNYYWSVHQSEWASDIMFKSPKALSEIYPQLVGGAMSNFCAPDVMRFLGRKPHGNFKGEVISDYKKRVEGIRVKHRVGANSVKMYDKGGQNLRLETTINNAKDFKVFRPLEGNPQSSHDWREMRRGIADIKRRAQVSQASNERYANALASLNTDSPINKLVDPVCCPIIWNGRRMRALRPWSEEDQSLIQIISRGEFAVNGFRNRDLFRHLFPDATLQPEEKRHASARITRKLRLLRAHSIIRKVPKTHRYVFTKKGREIATAILEYQNVTLEKLKAA